MIFLITFLIYTPALKNDFVSWDDEVYVCENNHINSLNLRFFSWMLTTFYAGNWHPLTWLSHATDYAIWGLNPFGHHLTSIILHGMNTLLVFLLVMQLMLRGRAMNQVPTPSSVFLSLPTQHLIAAVVTALMFGLHPLHVESVAWVAERKDLLCAFFFLLTLCSYLFYTSSVAAKNRRAWFTACIVFTTAALMAKPMAVTLPLVLLLLDIYPLKRIAFSEGTDKHRKVLLEKVPFFLLIFISALVTVLAQHSGGAFKTLERMPLHFKLLNALHSPFFYLANMLWPVKLVPFYPFPADVRLFDLTHGISGILALTITAACIWLWKRGRILFFTAWAYYLITLLPVVGIIQVGSQAAADRYTYLPSVSIFLLAGIGVSQLFAALGHRKSIIISGGVIVALIFILFGQLTVKQIAIWQDSETLWKHVIKSFPGRLDFAQMGLGNAYARKGEYDKAIEEYEKALALNPTHVEAHNNLGNAYLSKGKYDKAIEEYEKALAGNPSLVEAHNNMGNAYARKGEFDKAIEAFEKALVSNPTHVEAHNNLGNAYMIKGKYDKAIEEYEKALALNPTHVEAHNNLGNAYVRKGEYDKAIEEFEKALASNPNLTGAYLNVGNIYYAKGMLDEAIVQYKKALAINPDFAAAHNFLGKAYYRINNYSMAEDHLDKALALGYKVDRKLLESVKRDLSVR